VEDADVGLMMAINFFEKSFMLLKRLVHFSAVRPRTVTTFAQLIFSPLAMAKAMAPSTPILKRIDDTPK
jgi:hypothetical protein